LLYGCHDSECPYALALYPRGCKIGREPTTSSKDKVLARVGHLTLIFTNVKSSRAGVLKDQAFEINYSAHLVPSHVTKPLQHLLLFRSFLLKLPNLGLLLLNIAIHVGQLLQLAQSFADLGLDGDHLVGQVLRFQRLRLGVGDNVVCTRSGVHGVVWRMVYTRQQFVQRREDVEGLWWWKLGCFWL